MVMGAEVRPIDEMSPKSVFICIFVLISGVREVCFANDSDKNVFEEPPSTKAVAPCPFTLTAIRIGSSTDRPSRFPEQ